VMFGAPFPDEMLKIGPVHPAYGGYGVYKCKNGHISIAILNEEQWLRLLKAMGPEYDYLKKIRYFGVTGLERFKASKTMNEAIEDWTSKHTCEEIEEILKKPDIDIPCLRVPSFYEILENKHYQDREMFVEVEQPFFGKVKIFGCPIKMASVKSRTFKHAPLLGEHNEEILKWLGYSEDEVLELYKEEVLKRE